MVTLEDLKDELNIDFPDMDRKLQRKLDAAIAEVARYTDVYMYKKDIQVTSDGCPLEFFEYPLKIVSVKDSKGKDIKYSKQQFRLSTEITAPRGSIITLIAGDDPTYKNACIDEGILRLAVYLFENVDAREVAIPLDVQLMINKERRSATI